LSRVGSATRTWCREEPLPPLPLSLHHRAAGALVGAAAGRAGSRAGAADGSLALALDLAEELAAGRRDLQALAYRWVERWRAQPERLHPETAAALAHLDHHDAPPSAAAGRSSDPLVVALPLALAAAEAPRTLVSATWHVVALTHPEPVVQWSAVAVNLALGRLLGGHRDFVPEVIAALRANDAPAELLEMAQAVPLARWDDPGPGSALADAAAALRLAYHEPLLARGLGNLRVDGASAGRAALAGALLGARDGADRIPADWLPDLDRANLQALAGRIVHPRAAAG
jgi:ADP-ribosyl-[dinitrogen reductase] hydrolase